MFESLYNSPWLATFVVAGVSLVGFMAWARRQSFLVAYVSLFTLEILADALRSGRWSPLAGSRWEDMVGLGFVIVGDYRYFLLVMLGDSPALGRPRLFSLRAVGWTFIVPVLSLGAMRIFPAMGERVSYLVWELLFLLLLVGLRVLVFPRRWAAAPAPVRKWLSEVTLFEGATYGLWALADVIILARVDAGFALRLVPNLLYYGLFVPFVAFRAPRSA